MSIKKINGGFFFELLEAGFLNLSLHHKAINDLNVFPVPDGDTGTNMKVTFRTGIEKISNKEEVGKICDELAEGMLFGARGNSGVLLSQYFKGIAISLHDKKDIVVSDFINALKKGYETSYASCLEPKEGTILTVQREGIENAIKKTNNNTSFEELFAYIVEAMRISLDNTPNLLSVLKEAGVIDSGGKGLLTIFEGFLKYIKGEDIEKSILSESIEDHVTKVDFSLFNEKSNLDYGYCTEFLLQLLTCKINIKKFDLDSFISFLQSHGDSIVCFQTGTIVKVHIHTKKPYEVIEFAQKFGEFITFKMENMSLQHNEVVANENAKKQKRKKYAIVSIAQGDGIIDLFKELGSDVVLNGGTTMNTSAAEMIDAFKIANADTIFLLPNEANIIFAARQAKNLYKKSDIRLIETKNIPQGYAALSMLMTSDNMDEIYDSLVEGSQSILSGFIAQSSRNSTIDGKESSKGNYIENIDDKLVSFKPTRKEATIDLLSHISDIKTKQALILIKSQLVSMEEANDTVKEIRKKYPNLDVNIIDGKQDVYDYLIGIDA